MTPPRTCECCGKDIEHLNATRRFCSTRCQRRGGERSVYVSEELHARIKAEAERRGVTMTALVEQALRPALVKGEA